MKKRILGLDLGTNSIGWAITEQDFEKKEGKIIGLGSRIIPMGQDVLGKFDSGVSISQTAERTGYRGVRRLIQRNVLRRERLHRALHILGYLPKHYADAIDFELKLGQFKNSGEVKLNYCKNEKGKHSFIFMDSFNQMVQDFQKKGLSEKIPLDWTIYYLRKKALSNKITKEELAWILLSFNQKRGYYQLRGDESETNSDRIEEFHALKVAEVQATDDKNARGTWHNVILENGWIYRRQSKESLDNWVGKTKEFIVTTTLEKDGALKLDKEGNVKRSFRAVNSENDWIAIKKKTERDIENSNKTVGQYIYESLLDDPTQKIRGKLIKTIERKFYKEELVAILEEQIKHHKELQTINDNSYYKLCIEELYPRNEAHFNNIKDKDFIYLFVDDIIFYQRPLKSKKSTISNCGYEKRTYKKNVTLIENGTEVEKVVKVTEPLKGISKSHPLYQEFRLWQFLKNLKIYKKENTDIDMTLQLLPSEDDWVELFDFLSSKKEIEQKQLIQYFIANKRIQKVNKEDYRWNYVEDRKYPCNETTTQFISRLSKVKGVEPLLFLTEEIIHHLWHIIYSVKDPKEFKSALAKFAIKYQIDVASFVDNFEKFPPFKNEYGAYSQKAINKLLTLMRRGKYWNKEKISQVVIERVNSILERLEVIDYDKEKIDENVIDDDISQQLLKSFSEFKEKNSLTGLNTYQACYAVYNRHSEVSNIVHWEKPEDINQFLKNFKQHGLRNPIVEQVVMETLRLVKDAWVHFGDGSKEFFDEIHIELGREMKNDKKTRERISKQNTENENTNERIKLLLQELKDEGVKYVKPYSPSQREILKLYEEGVYQNMEKVEDDIDKIRKNNTPTKKELTRYKLWLDQGYISPYTGETIELSRLFTTDYQIEHVIPQSRYFDDSLSNKIICESAVNELKSNLTAYEFIEKHGTEKVDIGQGKSVEILSKQNYETHCNQYFKKNRNKLKKLLSAEIPEGFINRQLNDSRYISKLIKGLLSNLVREQGEREAISKHVLVTPGAITSTLKNDWGLNDKWNEILVPRFKRLNEMTNSEDFGYWDKKINAFRTQVPDKISRGFVKKRIDHRHHALDAIVIACTTKDHVNYITSINTERKNYKLVKKLRVAEEIQYKDRKTGELKTINKAKSYHKPWGNFTSEVKKELETTVVSFKQNARIINKTNNKTWQWVDKGGQLKKQLVKQNKGDNWAIRKPLHKETIYGNVTIKRKQKNLISFSNALNNREFIVDKKIKLSIKQKVKEFEYDLKKAKKYFKDHPLVIDGKKVDKVEVFEKVEATASRISLTEKFTRKQLESVTDSGIQAILERHLLNYVDEDGKERFDLAFNSDGVEELNKNIKELNNGKNHLPIYKVRTYEVGNRFAVGETGNKNSKYVEAAKGTNLFFAIYWNEEKQKRVYDTIPLNEVIAHQKQVASFDKRDRTPVPIDASKGQFLFTLSPNDLVYVPTDEELENQDSIDWKNLNKKQVNRIYKMVSSSGNQCFFIRNDIAKSIQNKFEFSALNKMEKDFEGNMIKERCRKLKLDRLGNIRSKT